MGFARRSRSPFRWLDLAQRQKKWVRRTFLGHHAANFEEMQAQNIFLEVKDSLEKARLFETLANNRVEIMAKSLSPGSLLFTLKAYQFENSQLRCLAKGEVAMLPVDDDVILQFQLGADKYVFQARMKRRVDLAHVATSSPLFRIQRRADFRIRVPKSFSASLKIRDAHFDLLDLSAGGCKIQVEKSFVLDPVFSGELSLRKQEHMILQLTRRHRGPDPSSNEHDLVGLQFTDISEKSKNLLAGIVMDIYREYLRK